MSITYSSPSEGKSQIFINESVKELCLNHGTLLKLKKNSVLFDEEYINEKPYVYYLVEGICSISGISIQGQEQTFVYMKAGEMAGHVPYMMSKTFHSAFYAYRRPTVITKTECILYKIPEKHFVDHMHTNIEFSNYLNEILARNYSTALAHLKQVQEDSVVTIVCRFLLRMANPCPEGLLVPKFFTYSEIAKYFGIHEITVTRIIGKLKQDGHISRSPAGILIHNPDVLRELILQPDSLKYK